MHVCLSIKYFSCYPGPKRALGYLWLAFKTTETFSSRETEVEYTRSAPWIYDVPSKWHRENQEDA